MLFGDCPLTWKHWGLDSVAKRRCSRSYITWLPCDFCPSPPSVPPKQGLKGASRLLEPFSNSLASSRHFFPLAGGSIPYDSAFLQGLLVLLVVGNVAHFTN